MKVRVYQDAKAVARRAADLVCQAVAAKPDLTLGLPTGRTAVPLYQELACRFRDGQLDLSRARGLNIDELLLPRGHASCFHSFMESHAWGCIGLDRSRCDIPDSGADPAAECRRYDRALAAAGGFDLAILGVGADGHVAYNLPEQIDDHTHLVRLGDSLAESLAVPSSHCPLRAITLGMGAFRDARHLLLMASGGGKAEAIRRLVDGPATAQWPCSLLRTHASFEVLVDHAAGGSV